MSSPFQVSLPQFFCRLSLQISLSFSDFFLPLCLCQCTALGLESINPPPLQFILLQNQTFGGKHSLGPLGILGYPFTPSLAQDSPFCRNKVGGLPGAWTRLLAGLLLLAVSSSLALRQLQGRNSPKGNLGPVDLPASRHSHHPGVYHHSAVISPAGQCLGRGCGSVVQGTSPSHIDLSLLQPHVPNWAKSCLSLGAMSWMLELEQLCVWRWCILMQQG